MPLINQTVVIDGATGVVGSGIVRQCLHANATVIAISRSAANLDALRSSVNIDTDEPFIGLVGEFATEATATDTVAAIAEALKGATVDHVITSQGFIAITSEPTNTDLVDVERAIADGLYNNFLAAKTLIPLLRDRAGSSFTFVSGGLAHIQPPMPAVWLGTVKNAALNGLGLAFAGETTDDAVRVNVVCVHFNVAAPGGTTNQAGVPADHDTHELAPAFLAVLTGSHKGETICLDTWGDARTLATTGSL